MLEVMISVIAGLSTLVGGLISLYFSKKDNKAKDINVENIILKRTQNQNEIDKLIDDKVKSLEKSDEKPQNVDTREVELMFLSLKDDLNKRNANEISAENTLITNFYEQGLSQSKIIFFFSIIAASIGFAFIIFYIIISAKDKNVLQLVNIIPGIVIDSIAYLFIRHATEIRNRASDLLDKLRLDNQRQKALELVEKISNDRLKDLMLAQISINTSGVNTTADDFGKIVSLIYTENKNDENFESKHNCT
ncbi:hypothetical protein FACS1894110_22790 [Spirochaetia bacterium]|nr:hypothetical protein FACS1894110_22790 [Spirochaetia bacterium]